MPPWRNWFHCMGSAYGQWLPGDPRGWRARHHREHVEGDYKNPPPAGRYDDLFRQSKALMKHDAVVFTPEQRRTVCLALTEALPHHEVELVDLCVSATHYHVLARFTPFVDASNPSPCSPRRGSPTTCDHPPSTNRDPRHIMGLAKTVGGEDSCQDRALPARQGLGHARQGVAHREPRTPVVGGEIHPRSRSQGRRERLVAHPLTPRHGGRGLCVVCD